MSQTITEFLEARIDEDEQRASSGWARLGDSRWDTTEYGQDILTPSAVLAECAAKRAIIALHDLSLDPCDEFDASFKSVPCETLLTIAAVYKDHPDYRQEWAV